MSDKKRDESVEAKTKVADMDAAPCVESLIIEALIKEVAAIGADQVSFKLEPISPYVFEKKKDDGSAERCLLFVDDAKKPCKAEIVATDKTFVAPKPVDYNAMLIAKVNRLRVRIEVVRSYDVKSLTVL